MLAVMAMCQGAWRYTVAMTAGANMVHFAVQVGIHQGHGGKLL